MLHDFNFNNTQGSMTTEEIIAEEIKEFNTSSNRYWMLVGDRYYKVENDIKHRKIMRQTEDGEVEALYKANNKLAHGKVKNLVDEKVSYLLSKDFTLECDNKSFLENIKSIFKKGFNYQLQELGYDSSNAGIAWLQAYINEVGELEFMVIPPEQCVPLWEDRTHTKLQAMIRYYNQIVYEGRVKKVITKVEYYTKDTVDYYVMSEDYNVMLDSEMYLKENDGPIGHYKKGGEAKNFGRVPFIAFKNNRLEYPDIRFIKSLVDNYDMSRSDVANFIEEVKNLIYVLKGYGGESLSEFMSDLNYYKAIKIDDPTEGGVDTLNPEIDITATKEHYEQLKRDIIEDGQGVPKDLDKYGNSPSGIALKFMYSGLDLKCNLLEREYKRAFEELLYFIKVYLSEAGKGNFEKEEVNIIFNRDIAINETEAIDNCVKSLGLLSDETVIAQHPWTKDADQELAKVNKEKETKMETFNPIPVGDTYEE